jgi:hypothetical protein
MVTNQIFQFIRAAVALLTILSLSLADGENSESIFPIRLMGGVKKVTKSKEQEAALRQLMQGSY